MRRGKSENHANEHVYAVLQVAKSFHHCEPGQPCTHGVTVSSFNRHYDENYPNSTVFSQKVILLWRVLSQRVEGCGMSSCFSHHGEMDASYFAFSFFVQVAVNQSVPRTWCVLCCVVLCCAVGCGMETDSVHTVSTERFA